MTNTPINTIEVLRLLHDLNRSLIFRNEFAGPSEEYLTNIRYLIDQAKALLPVQKTL
jgi:hypothetical protein